MADPMDDLTYVEEGTRTLVSCGCWWDSEGGIFRFHPHALDCPVMGYVKASSEQLGVPFFVGMELP